MIERATAYKASDGQMFNILMECQEHEISLLCKDEPELNGDILSMRVASFVLRNAVKIVDILTTTPTSKPKARKANGGTKVRKPKTPEPSTPA